MKACVFPGQGSQFAGMGQKLLEDNEHNIELLNQANDILGFDISRVMISGTEEELKQTKVTQPAVFLYAYLKYKQFVDAADIAVLAGHSLGEITALVASGALNFESGLKIVSTRANAMQKACEAAPSTMAAILGMEDQTVESICETIEDVIPANYNCPGQLVISGSEAGINSAISAFTEAGARRAIKLNVGGAFHSPFMQPAYEELAQAIESCSFENAKIPVYQNVDANKYTDAESIKSNLLKQLTSPVKWTQIMHNMIAEGVEEFIEPGAKVLSGFVKKVDRKLPVSNFA